MRLKKVEEFCNRLVHYNSDQEDAEQSDVRRLTYEAGETLHNVITSYGAVAAIVNNVWRMDDKGLAREPLTLQLKPERVRDGTFIEDVEEWFEDVIPDVPQIIDLVLLGHKDVELRLAVRNTCVVDQESLVAKVGKPELTLLLWSPALLGLPTGKTVTPDMLDDANEEYFPQLIALKSKLRRILHLEGLTVSWRGNVGSLHNCNLSHIILDTAHQVRGARASHAVVTRDIVTNDPLPEWFSI
jgi:hypothetical protein